MSQDTEWESNSKTQLTYKQETQEVSPFSSGDHKAAMNKRESMKNTRHNNTKKYCLGTVSKNVLLEGLKILQCFEDFFSWQSESKKDAYFWFCWHF